MSHSLSLIFVLLYSQIGLAGLPPQRPQNLDYHQVAAKLLSVTSPGQNAGLPQGFKSTVFASRTSLEKASWSQVPEVNPEKLKQFFFLIRDEKQLKDENQRARRLPWMFPDSGCFARAEAMAARMQEVLGLLPLKLFAFGNLVAKTEFHPTGFIHWWYHVAPIVRVGDQVYVIDPSIQDSGPLELSQWLEQMNAVPEVSICQPHSYDPNSDCLRSDKSQFDRAIGDLGKFLKMEWSRLIELGFDPETKLQ